MDEYLGIVMFLVILTSVALPFIETYMENRKERIRQDCLLIANDHNWISIEELSGLVGVSLRTATKNIEWGIKERIIVGSLENNMFERSYQRTPEDIAFYIPHEQDDS